MGWPATQVGRSGRSSAAQTAADAAEFGPGPARPRVCVGGGAAIRLLCERDQRTAQIRAQIKEVYGRVHSGCAHVGWLEGGVREWGTLEGGVS